MVTYFNAKDLVKFGHLLLSDERINRIKSLYKEEDPVSLNDRLKTVYELDLINFKSKIKPKDRIEVEPFDEEDMLEGVVKFSNTLTVLELAKAFQKWNIDVIDNPTKHETPSDCFEDAELQAIELMKHLQTKR